MKWHIESFKFSDGSKQDGVTVDHTAWLKGEGFTNVYISLNMQSRGVPNDIALKLLNDMVDGLNDHDAA